MIRETIVTTSGKDGAPHVAPMGATVISGGYVLQPFRPSVTLDNLLESRCGVLNYTDDARIFAGCVTRRKVDWPVMAASEIGSVRLSGALAHEEFEIVEVEEDAVRPRLVARPVRIETHGPFRGMNRARAAVLEGAVLVSRLHILPPEKIDAEIAYLSIAVEKTAGPDELEAWGWLMDEIARFRRDVAQ